MTVQFAYMALPVIALILGGFAFWNYRSRSEDKEFLKKCVGVGIVCTGAMAVYMPIMSYVPLLVTGTAAGCSFFNLSSRWGRSCIAIVTLTTCFAFAAWIGSLVYDLEGWKQRYPLVSLSDRLNYESEHRVPIKYKSERPWSDLVTFDDGNVTDFERVINGEITPSDFHRNRSFQSLLETHRSMEEQFTIATGFGVRRTRALPYRRWQIDIPDRPLILLPRNESRVGQDTIIEGSAEGVDYRSWHNQNQLDFAHPRTLGYVPALRDQYDTIPGDLSRVIGFVPHGLSSKPDSPAPSDDAHQPWRITPLSLVSLLKHRPPAAYVSDHLPNMQELVKVPTRDLDAFEKHSLEKLRAGEELAVETDSSQIRMLGAIRAAYQCQECHQVKRGALLGAFSYQLVRSNISQQDPDGLAEKTSGQ